MEQQTSNLNSQVREINEILRGLGKEAVQEIKMTNKEGKTVGQIKYGYRPQWVFDAVNQVVGAENWRHELVKEEIFDNQAVAEVRLHLKVNGEWLCKGSQKGQSQIVKGNVGDAQKGAITNAVLKCFSLVSVGSDAYKGLLGAVYNGRSTRPAATAPKPAQASSKSAQAKKPAKSVDSATPAATTPAPAASSAAPANTAETPQNQTDSVGLPQIAGVTYEQRDGLVIATGKVYDKRNLLKSAGFRWDGTDKVWSKAVEA
ncbi:hypothetical protein ACHHRT_12745 [Desulfurivibrio sp. D14AmB]|uniref:hypothetical protein n=1 Tax=Desulfurivibrio sp. D14AmB TaxID=3374370 RepID=UPI00376F37E1